MPPQQQNSCETEQHWSTESTCTTTGKENCYLD